MPPHELESTFTSKIFNMQSKTYEDDFLGDFDLTMISDTGNMSGCKRKQSGKPVTGQAEKATGSPFSYDVRINQTSPIKARYFGVALRNDEGDVTRIVGYVQYGFTSEAQRREFAGPILLVQDETTWIVTKP